jgi:hypothetical protein
LLDVGGPKVKHRRPDAVAPIFVLNQRALFEERHQDRMRRTLRNRNGPGDLAEAQRFRAAPKQPHHSKAFTDGARHQLTVEAFGRFWIGAPFIRENSTNGCKIPN